MIALRPPGRAGAAAGRAAGRAGRRAGRGALLLIAGLFFASGLARMGDGAGPALAREIGAFAAAAIAAAPTPADGAGEVDGLLAALRLREARLAQAEARIDERARALAVAEEEVARGLARMAEAEAGLRGLLALADTAAEEDVARLTAMYEAMKPAEAAALFAEMEPGFAAGFLGRMRPDAAGALLAGLPPEKAYALSVVLAGRNAAAAAGE
jgi:flagellar motility protein MotE (MotC chaperone)